MPFHTLMPTPPNQHVTNNLLRACLGFPSPLEAKNTHSLDALQLLDKMHHSPYPFNQTNTKQISPKLAPTTNIFIKYQEILPILDFLPLLQPPSPIWTVAGFSLVSLLILAIVTNRGMTKMQREKNFKNARKWKKKPERGL